ncbi:hypothetical protein P2G88_04790 [Aliiglaciecola sp. CAU 1673]|uniref:hypothetical protein n=1 Tax=Aliiglaciecola sp. CAU 1673 TaxID=3032595 RepID=UPI0023DC152C|nr:hypothetical protein [Aliiglaciecola sp. CAU 1673]MDF2177564.1 hypothetical protein [Aliiglaciecola sp. CAU 1673]
MKKIGLFAIALPFILTACGGGNSGSGDGDSQPPPPPSLSIQGPTDVTQGQSVALIALSEGELASISWRQNAGPSVDMQTSQSQVLAFEIPEAGNYVFEVQLQSQSGQQLNAQYSFSAQQASTPSANLRLDHVVAEGAKVSLRADYTGPQQVTAITWQRVSGPAVTTSHNQDGGPQHLLFYDAPRVTADTLMQWQATLTLDDGSQVSDNAYVLVKNLDINSEGFFPKYASRIVTSEVHPYRADSPYAAALKDCVYNNRLASACSFARLPLLGTKQPNPSIDDVLDRLLVSHRWMGDNFKRFLEQSETAPDILKLLAATTAIVITYDTRPSFYWTATGAIYLDAANLWLTPTQRDVLNDQPDYRTDFGKDLAFTMPWRYVKNQQSFLVSYPAALRQTRAFRDMEAQLTWLLYHELAHANDYFAWHRWAGLRESDNPLSFSNANAPSSRHVSQQYALQSEAMRSLAQVSFSGQAATATQKAYLPMDIEQFFVPDVATDYYSYTSEREDFALAFQHFMMALRLGAEADVGILASLNNPQALVSWGQRNRHNSDAIRPRVKAVVESIFPELDATTIQLQLPGPQLMRRNESWWDNLVLEDAPQRSREVGENKITQPMNGPNLWHPPGLSADN